MNPETPPVQAVWEVSDSVRREDPERESSPVVHDRPVQQGDPVKAAPSMSGSQVKKNSPVFQSHAHKMRHYMVE